MGRRRREEGEGAPRCAGGGAPDRGQKHNAAAKEAGWKQAARACRRRRAAWRQVARKADQGHGWCCKHCLLLAGSLPSH